jgi:hypothetical protein
VRPPLVSLASFLLLFSSLPCPAAEQGPSDLELIVKYVAAREAQQRALRGLQMDVEIDGRLPKMEKNGKLNALRSITKLGKIIYKQRGFVGDELVKKDLIARYLSAEVEERDNSTLAISPANYKFKLKKLLPLDGRDVAIFELTPRQKRVGLFKGELWIDVETGMPLRESGKLVKNPSVFLKKVEFESEYELKDGMSFPKHRLVKSEVRLFGKAELDFSFSNYSPADSEETASVQ